MENFVELALVGMVIAGFTCLAYLKSEPIIFLFLGGISLISGLEWRHLAPGNIGLTISLGLICYAILCEGMAFRYLLAPNDEAED